LLYAIEKPHIKHICIHLFRSSKRCWFTRTCHNPAKYHCFYRKSVRSTFHAYL